MTFVGFYDTIFLQYYLYYKKDRDKMDINSLVIGIISGIVSSIIIYLLVFQVKPKIKISSKVSRTINDKGNVIYRFKIINKTKFAIFNLKYSLNYCYKQSDGIINFYEIEPSKTAVFYISPCSKKDKDDKHALRISYEINEEKYALNDDSYLCFTIVATHSFSNTSMYQEVNYYQSDIVDGVFETGDSLKVLNVKNTQKTPILK